MAFHPPSAQPSAKGGMMFVNPPGVANFRALRVESGDQHLYWQPTYQHLLRVEGAFGEFFPQAEFSENGNQVIFTKFVDKVEVLAQTRSLRPGERIPRGEWQRFMETWANFKRLADRTDVPEDVRNFILKFGPPSVERYPAAYRIYRPHWYSKPRLFILWGLEPVGGAEFVSLTAEEAITEATARAETDSQEASGNLLHWLKLALICLLGLALLLFLLWLCLPRPVVDFTVSAEAEKPAKVVNLTTIDRSLDWGSRENLWTFKDAKPELSTDFEPAPIWSQPGDHEVNLSATQSTLWGLLYKTETLSKVVGVTPPPSPQPEKGKPGLRPKGENAWDAKKDKGGEPPTLGDKPNPDSIPEERRGKGMPPSGPSDRNQPRKSPGEKPPAPGDRPGEELNMPRGPSKTLPSDLHDEDGKPKAPMPGRDNAPRSPNDGQPMPNPNGGKDGTNPDERRSPGGKSPGPGNQKMPPSSEPNPDSLKPKLGQDKLPKPGDGVPTPDGQPSPMPKLPPEEKDKSGKMLPPADSQRSPVPQPKDALTEEGKGGKMLPPGAPEPSPDTPRGKKPDNVRTLPVPSVQIREITVVPGGASQDIDFTLNLPAGVRVERLSVDGKPVGVSPGLGFRVRLGVGPHSVRIEYGAPNGDLHGEVTQDVVVDRDEVRIIKPRTRIEPPVQVPGAEQTPTRPAAPRKVRDEAAEKFDKKTA